ncbi:N2227-like protein-domain-containing protein [Boeremia exigua]|uniref:N2227-like protein-domain-containing protein n=1 Tax=Boeremia exigua TaxID=749465 RepID=UPI001E8C9EA6|nr:N2227-like protein-domain-containing protein [Boeremia exigua]KAH6629125.1 N2227-like protein-domain-containing protein [Boeremia exigua]
MRLPVVSTLLLAAGFTSLAGSTDSTPSSPDGSVDSVYIGNKDDAAQDPLKIGSMGASESPRHRHEKVHLMKRMNRKTGKWNTVHPRYRLLEALYGFTKYRERNMAELDRWRSMYGNVGKSQKKVLEKAANYTKKLKDIEELIYANEVLCKAIIANAMTFYGIEQKELDAHIKEAETAGRVADRVSPSQTLKHFVRDWADEGSKERADAFPCILSTLNHLQASTSAPAPLKILLPGSGVGRLGTEIANLGAFEVTLNEWSMYMNIGYRFLFAPGVSTSTPASMHPFIDGLSHHATTADLLRAVQFPNVKPSEDVLLVEGDFNTAFNGQNGHYDIIVTHFFIDTARNLMSYFDTIHRLLKPGGKWMNLGPLLYGTGPFVQLSLDEIVAVVEEMGFEFEDVGDECGALTFEDKKVRWTEAEYGFNGKALTRNAYKAQVWVARKI